MLKSILFSVTTLLFLVNPTARAQQANTVAEAHRWQAKIEAVNNVTNAKGIHFLKWSKDTILVESTASLQYTDIQGQFSEKITQATLNSKPMPVKEDGTFDIHFGFPGEEKTFVITAIDAKNKLFRTTYRIVPLGDAVVPVSRPSIFRFSAGLGWTRLSFRQANVTSFNQEAITVKGSAAMNVIPEKLDLGASAFFNLVPFGTNSPAIATNGCKGTPCKIQYIGVNARVIYSLLGAPSAFRINLSGGIYYNTSLSTIGFENMIGPQLYPEFIYVFNNGNSLLLYGKYSPALSQGKLSLHDNREVAGGMHYSFPLTDHNRMSVGVDLSQLSLSVTNGNWASTNTYSLSAGISF